MNIVYEDEYILVVNKDPGVVSSPENFPGLFLAHRLDKETSGVLILCKEQANLESFQDLFRTRQVKKIYLGLFFGKVLGVGESFRRTNGPLKLTFLGQRDGLIVGPIKRQGGADGRFSIHPSGRPSQTAFKVLRYFRYKGLDLSLVEVTPQTGRTHQIRVHLSGAGWPLAGDAIYGPSGLNERLPLKRQFLHAQSITFQHPFTHEVLRIEASMPDDLKSFLKLLKRDEKHI